MSKYFTLTSSSLSTNGSVNINPDSALNLRSAWGKSVACQSTTGTGNGYKQRLNSSLASSKYRSLKGHQHVLHYTTYTLLSPKRARGFTVISGNYSLPDSSKHNSIWALKDVRGSSVYTSDTMFCYVVRASQRYSYWGLLLLQVDEKRHWL